MFIYLRTLPEHEAALHWAKQYHGKTEFIRFEQCSKIYRTNAGMYCYTEAIVGNPHNAGDPDTLCRIDVPVDATEVAYVHSHITKRPEISQADIGFATTGGIGGTSLNIYASVTHSSAKRWFGIKKTGTVNVIGWDYQNVSMYGNSIGFIDYHSVPKDQRSDLANLYRDEWMFHINNCNRNAQNGDCTRNKVWPTY